MKYRIELNVAIYRIYKYALGNLISKMAHVPYLNASAWSDVRKTCFHIGLLDVSIDLEGTTLTVDDPENQLETLPTWFTKFSFLDRDLHDVGKIKHLPETKLSFFDDLKFNNRSCRTGNFAHSQS